MESKSARFWIRIFGYMLLISSLPFIIMGAVMVSTGVKDVFRYIGVKGLVIFWVPFCLTVASLLILFAGIGLLMLRNWGKILLILILPLFYILYLLVCVSGGGMSIWESLYRSSLIPIVYFVLIYFFMRPKVREQLK